MQPFAKFFVACALAAVCLMSGCASGKLGDVQPFNAHVKKRTPFLAQGPGQSAPPDGYLDYGARLRVINPAGDHVYVETVDGRTGFVAADDVNVSDGY